MPAKKTYNYKAMEHSNELEGHVARLRRNTLSGKEPTEFERDTFIKHTVELANALGWSAALLKALQGETPVKQAEPIRQTIVSPPVMEPVKPR